MDTHTDIAEFHQVVFKGRVDNLLYAHFNHTPDSWRQFRKLESLDPKWSNYVSQAGFPAGTSTDRTQSRALGVWALVVDDVGTKADRAMVEMALGPPTYEVLTSQGNAHWWYRLSKPVPVRQWKRFFKAALPGVPVDENTLDGTHVFRLPCGVNTKEEANGFLPCRGQVNPDVEIDVDKIMPFVVPIAEPVSLPTSGEGADIKLGLDDLRTCMSWLKNDARFVDRNAMWVGVVGHGLKALCLNDEDGLTVYEEWSDPEKYPGYTREKWKGFGKRGLESKGGKLKGLWQAANPEGFARMFAPKVFPPDPTEAAPMAAEVINFSVDQEKTSLEVVRHFAGRIKQVGRGDWREFDEDTGRWREWTGDHMMRRVLELVAERKQIAIDPEVAKKLGSVKFIEGIARAAGLHRDVIARATDFDRNALLLGVPSGVIDLRPGASRKIRKGRASEMVSKAMWVDPAPHGTPCLEWTRFLVEFTRGKPDLARWLQARAGYCLTGLMDEPVMPYYYGSGGNGKSVYLNALRSVWGEYGTQMDHRLLFEKQGGYHLAPLAVLAGVRLAVVTDVPSNAVWDVHIMKMLTGDDAITANRMHQNPITFKSTAKIDASGNGEPTVKDMDEGIRRRLKMLPMTGTPKIIDKQLGRKLYDEYPAILAWVLAGLDEYWRLGGFPASEQVDTATTAYHIMLDPFQRWLDEHVVKDGSDGAKVSATDLFRSWDTFRCADGKHNVSPANVNTLGRKMKDKGFYFSILDGRSYLRGYRVTADNVF